MIIKYIAHLSIHPTQQTVIEIFRDRVGTTGCFLETLKRSRNFSRIIIGKTQQIVGKHTFIVSAEAFIIIHKQTLNTVRTENGITFDLGIGEQEQATHALAAGKTVIANALENGDGFTGVLIYNCLCLVKQTLSLPAAAGTKQQKHKSNMEQSSEHSSFPFIEDKDTIK